MWRQFMGKTIMLFFKGNLDQEDCPSSFSSIVSLKFGTPGIAPGVFYLPASAIRSPIEKANTSRMAVRMLTMIPLISRFLMLM